MIDMKCILKKSQTNSIQVFGMQKCGSGTISKLCENAKNIRWEGHSTFIKDSAMLKSLAKSVQHSEDIERDGVFTRPSFKKDNSRISVAMIRNPFDLFLSFYFHGNYGANDISSHYEDKIWSKPTLAGFKRFILDMGKQSSRFKAFNFSCYYPYFDDGGSFVPDFAFKLESLQRLLDLRDDKIDPWFSHKSNKPKGSNSEIYDKEMKDIVSKYFKAELDIFGYSIDKSCDRIVIPKESISNILINKSCYR